MENSLQKLKFTVAEKDLLLKNIRRLKTLSKFHITPSLEDAITVNFKELVGFFPNIGFHTTFGLPFERLVINESINTDKKNKRLINYSQIKYPPKEVEAYLPYNRASIKKQSVFYAGFGILSAALETSPKCGQLFTVSKWKQKSDTSLFHFPIYYNERVAFMSEFKGDWDGYQKMLSKLDRNVSAVLQELLSFITEVFTKPVKGNRTQYLFSALFSNYYLTNPNSKIKCIYYPSVPSDFLSSNIACLPSTLDDFFDCVEVIEDICIKDPNNISKGWLSRRIAHAVNINPCASGEIKWCDDIDLAEMQILKEAFNFT